MGGERRWWPNKGLVGRMSMRTRPEVMPEAAKRRAMMWWPPMPPASAEVVHRRAHVPAEQWLVVDVRLRLVLWGEAIGPYLERPGLPCEAVEAVDGARCVLTATHQNVSISATAIVGSEADVGAQDGAGLAKQVLEILPAHAVRELGVSGAALRCVALRHAHAQSTHVANKEVYAPI